MTRHDYDLPADYEKRVDEGTMSDWYTAERCRRRAMAQETNFERHFEQSTGRIEQVIEAAAETVPVDR
jgi:hypothetical protein